MELFFKTLFEGIKQGTIAAWHDMKWYICGAAILLVLYLAYTYVRGLIDKFTRYRIVKEMTRKMEMNDGERNDGN